MRQMFEGETATQDESGRWLWKNCSYGSFQAFTNDVTRQRNRPKVTRQSWRGWDITTKVYGLCDDPLLRFKTTHHVRGTPVASIRCAKAYIDGKLGQDVAGLALAHVRTPERKEHQVPAPPPPTDTQCKRVHRLAADILEQDGHGTDHMQDYEFKNFYLTHGYKGKLFLVTEVGSKGDEGTAASIVCRTRRHIYIGVRGGCESLMGPKSTRFGYRNILLWGKET